MTPILSIKDLEVTFSGHLGELQALHGVGFDVMPGEIVGLVGETGSGKSLTARSILRLIQPPGRITNGSIVFEGDDLLTLPEKELRRVRGKRISMIFQDARAALNPLYRVGDQIEMVYRQHSGASRSEARERAVTMLRLTGIPSPSERMKAYPHQLSSGMCQRVLIAMSLSCSPSLVIADEPTTGLDVTIQAQILDLLRDLVRKFGSSAIFITHDLGVVGNLCDRVAVMYAGKIVETAAVDDFFANPQHPYTQGLIASMLDSDDDSAGIHIISGDVPDLRALPSGCAFHPRCPMAFDRCRSEAPELYQLGPRRTTRCFLSAPHGSDAVGAGHGRNPRSGSPRGEGLGTHV